SYHFHRIFRGMVGESLKEYVRRLRLERAAMQLKRSGETVTHVAFEAGYETHEAFTRAFRAMFGESPSQFRSNRSAVAFAKAPSGVHYDPRGNPEDFQIPRAGGEEMKVEIKKVEPKRVAFMRHVGPYLECGPTWERLLAWMGSHGLLRPGTPFIGICHDDPEVTPPEKIRYDACVPVDEDFEPEGDVGVQVIAGGEYAVTTHFGPYERLGETYAKLCGQWVPQSGRQLRASPCFDVYLNDPESTKPEDLLTDIHVPLESE
ncbi:unnamed protein product, partial [marine sediment metagenome]